MGCREWLSHSRRPKSRRRSDSWALQTSSPCVRKTCRAARRRAPSPWPARARRSTTSSGLRLPSEADEMIFIVKLTYTVPKENLGVHLDRIDSGYSMASHRSRLLPRDRRKMAWGLRHCSLRGSGCLVTPAGWRCVPGNRRRHSVRGSVHPSVVFALLARTLAIARDGRPCIRSAQEGVLSRPPGWIGGIQVHAGRVCIAKRAQ